MLRSLAQTANGDRGKAHIVIKANIGFSKRELDHGDFWTVHGKLFARFLVPDWTKAIVADRTSRMSRLDEGKAPILTSCIVQRYLDVGIDRLSRLCAAWFGQTATAQYSDLQLQYRLTFVNCLGRTLLYS